MVYSLYQCETFRKLLIAVNSIWLHLEAIHKECVDSSPELEMNGTNTPKLINKIIDAKIIVRLYTNVK